MADTEFILEVWKRKITPNKNWFIKFSVCAAIKSLDNPRFFSNRKAILELASDCVADNCIENLLSSYTGGSKS